MDEVQERFGGVVGSADLVKGEEKNNPGRDSTGRLPNVGDGLPDVVIDNDGAPSCKFVGMDAALDESGFEVEAASWRLQCVEQQPYGVLSVAVEGVYIVTGSKRAGRSRC